MAELYKVMIPGTIAWNDAGNNKAYIAGQIGLTFNGVSIYQVLKTSPDPTLQAMAKDTMHQAVPRGLAKRSPMTAGPMQAMLFKHSKYPERGQGVHPVHDGGAAIRPVAGELPGLLVGAVEGVSKMKFWTDDPKLAPYANAMDTIYYDGYAGPVSAAASAVVANYTVVDMFASVATGNSTPEQAAKGGGKTGRTVLRKGVGSLWGPLAPSSFGKAEWTQRFIQQSPSTLARRGGSPGCSTTSRFWSFCACCPRRDCCWSF